MLVAEGVWQPTTAVTYLLPKPERRHPGSASEPCLRDFQLTRLLNYLAFVIRASS
jgi:hypothetical protein